MKKRVRLISLVCIICMMFSLTACQKRNIEVTCQGKTIESIHGDDELDFSSLVKSRQRVEHGDVVTIDIEKNDDVYIVEYILREDGSHKYTKGAPIELLDSKKVSFEIKFNYFDLFSSNKLSSEDVSLRGYEVRYKGGILLFVLETNVGDLEKEINMMFS